MQWLRKNGDSEQIRVCSRPPFFVPIFQWRLRARPAEAGAYVVLATIMQIVLKFFRKTLNAMYFSAFMEALFVVVYPTTWLKHLYEMRSIAPRSPQPDGFALLGKADSDCPLDSRDSEGEQGESSGIFKPGDRVEVIDDIGNIYKSHVGIVTHAHRREMSVAQEVQVRLANGTEAGFFDFQLSMPPATATGDSIECNVIEHAGHLVVRGRITNSQSFQEPPLVTLLVGNKPQQVTSPDHLGCFDFTHPASGSFSIEVIAPGVRILSDLFPNPVSLQSPRACA